MTSSSTPSNALIPAPIAVPVFDDDDDDESDVLGASRDFDADAVAVAVTVAVTVAVPWTVTRAVVVSLGDVEPDVRLKMTCPASI